MHATRGTRAREGRCYMKKIIIDIDDSESVETLVDMVSEHWFNPKEMYSDLKANGKTNSPNFWNVTEHLLSDVSEYLGQISEEFLDIWNQKCMRHGTKIMGYHCTRHSNKNIFSEKGILPLSDETVRFSENKNQTSEAKEMLKFRSQRSPGPWFLLSYKSAKNPDNHFCLTGPEILLACSGYQVDADPTNLVPLVIHCGIPYSILPDKDYYVFCILRAYFNFIDPEDDSNNLFEGYSIDLKGKALDAQFIIRTEEVLASI